MIFRAYRHFIVSMLLGLVLSLSLVWYPSWAQEADNSLAETSTVELTAEEQAYIEANPVIKVHAESAWPPYNFVENGQVKGFSNEYIQLVAEKVGLEVEFIAGPTWDEFMTMLADKEIDVVTNMVVTEERKEFTNYSDQYVLDVVDALLSRKDKEEYTKLEQLNGKVLATVKGFYYVDVLTEHYPEINLLLTSDTLEAIKQVEIGNADAALETHAAFNYYIDRLVFTNLISRPIIGDLYFSGAEQHLGIRNDRPILKSILDKGMSAVSEDEITTLRRRWYIASDLASDIASTNLTEAEAGYLQQKRELQMCVDPDWMPLDAIIDGQHTGISADFFSLLNPRIGIPINLVETETWLESLKKLKQRHCDILSLAVETPARLEYANFSQPYLDFPLVIATREEASFIVDINDVLDRKIGIVQSYAFAEVLRTQYPDMQIVEVESLDVGLKKVRNGSLFGYVDVLPTTSYALQKRYPSLKIAGRFERSWELGVAVRNDEPELLSIFNKAIASVDEKDKQSILNNWISVRYEQGIDYRLIRRILFIGITILAVVLYRQYLLQKYNRKLERISITDALTGCFNRLKIEDCLEKQGSLFRRYHQDFSIILCDVDHFKRVNDTFGHLTGDAVLVETVTLLKQRLRDTDVLGRWGGEEFMIITPGTRLEGAIALAEILCQQLSTHQFATVGMQTASFGVAEFSSEHQSISQLISQADEALYEAKRSGRNCVIAYQEIQTL